MNFMMLDRKEKFMKRVWFITGAGKGIGYAIARAALKNNDYVVATTRKENGFLIPTGYEDNVLALQLDVSSPNEEVYASAVETAVQHFGRIDVLINNAGHGRITNFEETSEESIRELFEVNLFGLMRVTRAVLPVMRKQKSGYIFNVSSGAGYAPGPVAYHTSKFAVTGFSTSLAFEVAPFGITVSNIVPGLVRTGFYDQGAIRTEPDLHIDAYDSFRWQDDFMKNNSNHEQPGDPDKIAQLIVDAVNAGNISLHIPVTADAVDALDEWQQGIAECVKVWRDRANVTSFE